MGPSDSSILRSARVGADRSVKACAVHPCGLSDGICQNDGTCVEGMAEGGGAVTFECRCVGSSGDLEPLASAEAVTFLEFSVATNFL